MRTPGGWRLADEDSAPALEEALDPSAVCLGNVVGVDAGV